jgi:predicted PurR-regulated permease PerM
MPPGLPASPLSRFLVLGAAFVILVAGMQAAAPILVPFLLSLFITVIAAPPLFYLLRNGLPPWLAVLGVGLLVFVMGTLLALLIGNSLDEFSANLPRYQEQLAARRQEFWGWAAGLGFEAPSGRLAESLDPGRAMQLAGQLVTSLGGLLANGLLIMLTVLFMLFESIGFPTRLNAAFAPSRKPGAFVARFSRKLQRYMAIKALTSLATGVCVGVWLGIQGVDYPLLWAMFAFLLNFVPNIGSIIAAIPPVLLALVQFGPGGALWTILGFTLINGIIGNLLEPRFLGRGLGLSTLVVFLSLIFWGWVLGPVGMLLSVPMTIAVKIALDSQESTRPFAMMLGSGVLPANRKE